MYIVLAKTQTKYLNTEDCFSQYLLNEDWLSQFKPLAADYYRIIKLSDKLCNLQYRASSSSFGKVVFQLPAFQL
jgi:hypothetical protein